MRSTAASMSETRRRQSPGGTNGLREDGVLQLRPESTAGHEIDAAPEHRLELLLDVEEAEEADGPIELDEQIDVAVRPLRVTLCYAGMERVATKSGHRRREPPRPLCTQAQALSDQERVGDERKHLPTSAGRTRSKQMSTPHRGRPPNRPPPK